MSSRLGLTAILAILILLSILAVFHLLTTSPRVYQPTENEYTTEGETVHLFKIIEKNSHQYYVYEFKVGDSRSGLLVFNGNGGRTRELNEATQAVYAALLSDLVSNWRQSELNKNLPEFSNHILTLEKMNKGTVDSFPTS